MKKSIQLKQQRAAKVTAQGTLIEARSANTGGEFTEDQDTQFRNLNAEIKALDTQIANEEAIEAAQQRAASQAADTTPAIPGGRQDRGEEAEKKVIIGSASILRAVQARMKNKSLEGAEKELDDLGRAENRAAGVNTPENAAIVIPMTMRAEQQTVSQDSGNFGGQLVHNQAPRVQDPFMPKTFLEELGATMFTGLTGGDLPLPNAQNYELTWLAEGAEASKQKQEFTGPVLSPKRASTIVSVTNRLIMQSSINVEQYLRSLLAQGGKRAIERAAINGSGGVAPTGILNTAGILEGSSSAAAAATHELLAELPGLINAADSSTVSTGWLMHPLVQTALTIIKKDAGSGRFLMEKIGELMAQNAVATSLVPELDDNGTAVYPLIYGDFSQLFIGQWGAMSLVVDPYTDAGKDSIRLIPNLHADVAIAKPSAFAVNTFITG